MARGTEKWRVGLLAQVAQAAVHHVADESVDIVGTQILLRVLLVIGGGIALHIEVSHDNRLFLVLEHSGNHTFVVGHGIVDALGGIDRLGYLREERLDLPFHLVDINVAYDNDGLQVGAIPLLVVVAQVLIGKVVYDVHRADGQTVFIFRTAIDDGHRVFLQSCHCHTGTSRAPLLVDDAALLVYLLVLQQNIVAPVVEHQQTGVEDALALQRCRTDVVDRLVHRGIGIEVGTKLHTDGLAPGHDA